MSSLSPIHELFTHLRNSARVGRSEAIVPRSRFTASMLGLLKAHGLITQFTSETSRGKPVFQVEFVHGLETKVLSRPGLRRYRGWRELKKLRDAERYLISTSAGLMTAQDGIRRRIGGELIVRIER